MDAEIARLSQDSTGWLADGREALIDELGRRLSVALCALNADREALEAAVRAGSESAWPTEVLGFWIAGLRHCGASWDDVSELLGTSRQAAHRRFGPWARRYRPLIAVALRRQSVPASRLERNARVGNSSDLGREGIGILFSVADADARDTLDMLSEQPLEQGLTDAGRRPPRAAGEPPPQSDRSGTL